VQSADVDIAGIAGAVAEVVAEVVDIEVEDFQFGRDAQLVEELNEEGNKAEIVGWKAAQQNVVQKPELLVGRIE
jgi:hypothetical protein